jgi:hypothetical protein
VKAGIFVELTGQYGDPPLPRRESLALPPSLLSPRTIEIYHYTH